MILKPNITLTEKTLKTAIFLTKEAINKWRVQLNINKKILKAGFEITRLTLELIQLVPDTKHAQLIKQKQAALARQKKLDGKIKSLEARLALQFETVNLKIQLNTHKKNLHNLKNKLNSLTKPQ